MAFEPRSPRYQVALLTVTSKLLNKLSSDFKMLHWERGKREEGFFFLKYTTVGIGLQAKTVSTRNKSCNKP